MFSVVVPWRHRPELRRTLTANGPLFARHDVELVIANCGGDPTELGELLEGLDLPSVRQVTMPDTAFNLSLARNIGAFGGSRPFLFFLDADVELRSDVFLEVRPILERRDSFAKVRKLFDTEPSSSFPWSDWNCAFLREETTTREMTTVDGRKAMITFFNFMDGSKCAPGLVFVTREHFLGVGGFNSALQGCGFEEVDFTLRLQFELGLRFEAIGEVLHLTHQDDTRAIHGQSRRDDHRENMLACYKNYGRCHFTGTYADDVRVWQSRIRVAA